MLAYIKKNPTKHLQNYWKNNSSKWRILRDGVDDGDDLLLLDVMDSTKKRAAKELNRTKFHTFCNND